MCGLTAMFEPGRGFSPALTEAMAEDLRHRGPDGGGSVSESGWALGFRRLAILDPTPASDQPMTDRRGRCTLVFNGEIYNYRALRAELAGAGVRFRSDGDTEAILEGYLLWGPEVFTRLEGMFALVLVDRERNIALAARDPFGIKPLYMLRRGALTAFASEMRPLHRLRRPEIDEAALAELVMFGWAAGRLSNYRGIDRLPGGTLVEVGLGDGTVRERTFSDPLETLKPERGTSEDEVHAATEQSIRDHLVSDVGYGLQLSGGIDSSLVAAVASGQAERRLTSFSISLGSHAYDESPYQRMVAERYGLDHRDYAVTGRDYAEFLPRAVAHMEGPTPHGGCVMLMMLCGHLRDRTKVVLTGEGADEMFGGYLRYQIWQRLRAQEIFARWLPPRLMPDVWPFRSARRLDGHDAAAWASVYHDIGMMNRLFPDHVPAPGSREAASGRFSDFRDRLFAVDQTAYLESLLVRQDKMSMAMSVEARVPFVHWPLLKAVNGMARNARVPGGVTKPVLKRLAERYLPGELIHRRKIGLWLPYGEWFSDPGTAGRFVQGLKDKDAPLRRFCDSRVLDGILAAPASGGRGPGLILQRIVDIDVWLRQAETLPAGPREG